MDVIYNDNDMCTSATQAAKALLAKVEAMEMSVLGFRSAIARDFGGRKGKMGIS